MGLLDDFTVLSCLLGLLDWIFSDFVDGLWLPLHAKEDHLFFSHLLDLLPGKDTTDVTLDNLSRLVLSLLIGLSLHLAIVHLLASVDILDRLVDLAHEVQVTITSLATTLVFLD